MCNNSKLKSGEEINKFKIFVKYKGGVKKMVLQFTNSQNSMEIRRIC